MIGARFSNRDFARALRASLEERADRQRAEAQRRYMKVSLPFYGVRVPEVRRLTHQLCRARGPQSAASWRECVQGLFDRAKHQEERYAANAVAGFEAYRAYQTVSAVGMYERMIRVAAWWDIVDELAHRLGDVLRRSPKAMKPRMRRWAKSEHLWIRRSAILCQLGFGSETDVELLFDCLSPSVHSHEFFLRKAIGWALRDLARHEPELVRAYVAKYEDQLSSLSRREARKHLD